MYNVEFKTGTVRIGIQWWLAVGDDGQNSNITLLAKEKE